MPRRGRHARTPRLEALEGRRLLTTFTVTSAADSGAGTLRDAITQADADKSAGVDTIDFSIGTGGLQTIALQSALPAVTRTVLIDGTSQPGTSATPRIELNGANAGAGSDGLMIEGGDSTVQGLVVDGFQQFPVTHTPTGGMGIYLEGPGGDLVRDCFVGTDPTGTTASANAFGVFVDSPDDTIGGTAASDGNLISGNGSENLYLGVLSVSIGFDGPADGGADALVEGNRIGTDLAGDAAIGGLAKGATADGIEVEYSFGSTDPIFFVPSGGAVAVTVGGTAAGAGNVIAGNPGNGITVDGSTDDVIQGNEIGVGLGGQAVGNGGDGIILANGSINDTIGGTVAGAANTIARNVGAGVDLNTLPRFNLSTIDAITIRGDSIYDNGAGDIDLVGVARTPNVDSGSASSPNRGQARPVITSAVASGGSVKITGTLDSTPTTPFTLDFYASRPTAAPILFGQAQDYLGSSTSISDASGHVAFSVTLPDASYAAGDLFTATATDSVGDTSEISDDYPIVEPPAEADLSVAGSVSPTTVADGGTFTITYVVTNSGPVPDPMTYLTLTTSGPASLTSVTIGTTSIVYYNVNQDGPTLIGTIGVGQSEPITLVYDTLGANDPDGGTFKSTAAVQGLYTDPDPADNTTSPLTVTILKPPAPALAVSQAMTPDPAVIGSPVVYTITVANLGTADATGVVVTDQAPPGIVAYVPSQGGDNLFDGVLTASFGTIHAGASATLTVATGPATIDNYANGGTVTSTNGSGPIPFASDPAPGPILDVTTAASPATATPGSPVAITVTVTNNGTTATGGFEVGDGTQFAIQAVSATQGTAEVVNDVAYDVIDSLASGQSATLTYTIIPTGVTQIIAYGNITGTSDVALESDFSATIPVAAAPPADYSDTGRTDLAAYLPSIGAFAIRPSGGGPDQIIPFGFAGAGQTIPVSADFFGTGSTDIAAYLPSIGSFAVRPPSGPDAIIPFGFAGAGQTIPAVGDYSGDGKDDIAAYLPSIGAFAIRPNTGGADVIEPFGFAGAGQTIPAPGDYDGDGKTDVAAYLPSIGAFAIRPSSGGPDEIIPFGVAGSIPMPGDYDGSGKAELAVYMPSLGEFAYRPANGNPDVIEPFGFAGAGQTIPAPGDYDGDGRTDLAVYLPAVGAFAVRPSSGGSDQITYFGFAGAGGTVPVTATAATVASAGVSAASVRAESVAPAAASSSRSAAVVGSSVPSARRRLLVAVAQGPEGVGPAL